MVGMGGRPFKQSQGGVPPTQEDADWITRLLFWGLVLSGVAVLALAVIINHILDVSLANGN